MRWRFVEKVMQQPESTEHEDFAFDMCDSYKHRLVAFNGIWQEIIYERSKSGSNHDHSPWRPTG